MEMTPAEFQKKARGTVLSRKNFNKIFCIGFNKTGTTTLETVLRLYGYSLPNQHEQEIRLSLQTAATNYSELIKFVNLYDAFQDLPFAQDLTFVAADALFPNSKFILTERESEKWFNSMTGFHKKTYNVGSVTDLTEKDILEKFNYLFPDYVHKNTQKFLTTFEGSKKTVSWNKLYDKAHYIKLYEQRNLDVKKYFSEAPEKLLVIDVTKEKDTQKICDFLNIPDSLKINMPHSNKT